MDLSNLSPDAVALIGFVALFTLMLLRVPVGMAMGLVGVCGYSYIVGSGPSIEADWPNLDAYRHRLHLWRHPDVHVDGGVCVGVRCQP